MNSSVTNIVLRGLPGNQDMQARDHSALNTEITKLPEGRLSELGYVFIWECTSDEWSVSNCGTVNMKKLGCLYLTIGQSEVGEEYIFVSNIGGLESSARAPLQGGEAPSVATRQIQL